MIPLDQWLDKAKRVPIGQSRRVYHGQERTPAMTVKNLPDRYTAYCHRCHEGAVHLKSHASLVQVEVQQRFMPWPQDSCPIDDSPDKYRIWQFLISKGMDYNYFFEGVPVLYSAKQQRLLVATSQGWLGRAIGGQLPKWCTYGTPAVFGLAPGEVIGSQVILVEDYFSKLKIRWAVPGITSIALLGTSLPDKLVAALIAAKPDAIAVLLDADKAGQRGSRDVLKRLQGLGFHSFNIQPPDDRDPKELRRGELTKLITEAPWKSQFCRH